MPFLVQCLFLCMLSLYSLTCHSLSRPPVPLEICKLSYTKRPDLTTHISRSSHLRVSTDNTNEDNNNIPPKGFGQTPRPRIISPNRGTHPELEKFMMMYTCKICKHRNAQMISKVAYDKGMVVSTCKQCRNKHLIADNQGKLDFPSFGKKIEDFLAVKGEILMHKVIIFVQNAGVVFCSEFVRISQIDQWIFVCRRCRCSCHM